MLLKLTHVKNRRIAGLTPIPFPTTALGTDFYLDLTVGAIAFWRFAPLPIIRSNGSGRK